MFLIIVKPVYLSVCECIINRAPLALPSKFDYSPFFRISWSFGGFIFGYRYVEIRFNVLRLTLRVVIV